MSMKRRNAHRHHFGQFFDSERFGIVRPNPPDGLADLGESGVGQTDLAHYGPLFTTKKIPKDFTFHQRGQHSPVPRAIQKMKKADDSFQ
jgi:hypothetical protein